MKQNPFLPRMWQRLFFAILFLVILAQIMPLALVFMEMPSQEEQRKKEVDFICSALAGNLDGRNFADARMYMDYFNKAGPELWFERDNGSVLSGIPVPGFSAQERTGLAVVTSPRQDARVWHGRGTWNRQAGMPLDLLAVDVVFKDAGPATMFIIYPNHRLPKVSGDFYKALAILILAGALVSYAVSRHLSLPLRRLQEQVMAIDEKKLDQPLAISGTQEVVAVARAVNHLTAELGRHTRNMTELVANISHELRSPLARMEGHAGFIEDGFDRASRQVEILRSRTLPEGGTPPPDTSDAEDIKAIRLGLRHLTLLKEEFDHMDNLVGTTLLSSRLDLNRTPPPFHRVDLTGLCRDVIRRRRLFIVNRGIGLSCGIAEDMSVSGDLVLIRQMISNLVDNAVSYVSARGCIDIQLDRKAGGIRFRIENTHPPFPREDLVRLFEPFFRAGQATGNGSGLGLALVEKIVTLHRGRVTASHTGTGLRMEVVFPAGSRAGDRNMG